MSVPVLLDCDPGHDDAVALLLAAGNDEIDLLAVTTVAGNCPLELATLNARISGRPSTSSPTITKCPFLKRKAPLRVVVKLNSVSFQ